MKVSKTCCLLLGDAFVHQQEAFFVASPGSFH